MTRKIRRICWMAGPRVWLAAAALTAAISLPGTGTAAASGGVEVTVVFTQDGRTVMTVTPPAGMPVRYEWVADSASDAAGSVVSQSKNKSRYDQSFPLHGTSGDKSAESAPAGRVARSVKAAYIVSKTGLRLIKSALFSVVTSLAQLYSDA